MTVIIVGPLRDLVILAMKPIPVMDHQQVLHIAENLCQILVHHPLLRLQLPRHVIAMELLLILTLVTVTLIHVVVTTLGHHLHAARHRQLFLLDPVAAHRLTIIHQIQLVGAPLKRLAGSVPLRLSEEATTPLPRHTLGLSGSTTLSHT